MTTITRTNHAQAVLALGRIGQKPDISKRDMLTITRRVLRHVCDYRASIHDERRTLRRTAAEMRHFLPFTKQAVEDLEQQAREFGAAQIKTARATLTNYGRLLIHDADGIMDHLGFEAVCDLLNVNAVDRGKARREGWRTLSELVAVRGLENSAERRGDERNMASPLYQACQVAIEEFIINCPDHLLPDPFAPGAPFGPKLPPDLRIVGK